jgi:DNA processing protein
MGEKIRIVKNGEADYPVRLLPYRGMPEKLFYLGELPEDRPTVAIVGARLCDYYGHMQAFEFGRALASYGVQIVSGMALGADSYALEGALHAGGRVFAVLGCGVDICYPRSNQVLYDRIIRNGGILSEFEPGTLPLSFHFPQRNRIISALADIVLVIEAKMKSGSLITADFALEQGKTVFALPGRVGDLLSDGCNYLIAQGSGIAYSAEAILSELHLTDGSAYAGSRRGKEDYTSRSSRKDCRCRNGTEDDACRDGRAGISGTAAEILKQLSHEPVSIEEIVKKMPFNIEETASALIELQMAGLAAASGRNLYVRT